MPTFVNHNRHRVYVQDPEKGLVKVLAGDEVEATGAFADNLEQTNGVYKKGSDEEKERAKLRAAQDQNLQNMGPKAYPAEEPEYVGPDGKSVDAEDIAGDDSDDSATVTSEDVPKKGTTRKTGNGRRKSSSRKSS